jgi:hypothetical protein
MAECNDEKNVWLSMLQKQGKLFAFLVTDGVVLTKVSEHDGIKLSKEFTIKPFQAGTRTINKWPQIRVDEVTDVGKMIPFIKNSYDQSQISIKN